MPLAHSAAAFDAALTFSGAVHLEEHDERVRPVRLPREALDRIPTRSMRLMVDAAAGVRVRFRTSANEVAVRLRVAPIQFGSTVSALPAFVDLVVNERVVGSRPVEGSPAVLDVVSDRVTFSPQTDQEIRFGGLGLADKDIELWLPHTAIVELVGVDADAPIERATQSGQPRWTHHGSSISHCLEAEHPTGTWPALAGTSLGLDLTNLAFAGNALLDPFVARAIRDTDADLISVKIGINLVNADAMRLRAFGPAVDGFLDTIRDGHPVTPLILLSPIACPVLEAAPGPTALDDQGKVRSLAEAPFAPGALTLSGIRQTLESIVRRRSTSDEHLHYLDGRTLFGDADAAAGHLPDGLHPDGEGYRLMAERFVEQVEQMRANGRAG